MRFPLLVVFALLTGSCGSEVIQQPPVMSSCFEQIFPADTELTVLTAYEGPVIRVTGGWFTRAQVIVVSAHEAVLWDFSDFPAGKLRGIIVYGDNPTFHGVPDVPVRFVGLSNMGSHRRCGSPISASRSGVTLDALVAQAEEVTGITPTRVRAAYNPESFDASSNGQQPAVVDPNRGRAKEDNGPGFANLAPLIAEGAIRPATSKDIAAYNYKVTATLRTGKFVAYEDEYLGSRMAYVVLKPFTIPSGMYGANSRMFIVPAGMSAPIDRGSHNEYFFMEDGRCTLQSSDCPGSKVDWPMPVKPTPKPRQTPTWDDSEEGSDDSWPVSEN